MAKTNVAVFAQTPLTSAKVLSAAVSQTGTGSISDVNNAVTGAVELLTAGADGAIVTRAHLQPRGTIAATVAYLFIRPANAGENEIIMIDSTLLSAVTMTVTATSTKTAFTISEASPLRLGAGDKLFAAISVAQSVGITAYTEYTNF
jgi:hypothetical protein